MSPTPSAGRVRREPARPLACFPFSNLQPAHLFAMRHLLAMTDLKPAEIERIFSITVDLKAKFEQGVREPLLP
ncbi:MAG: hypothetical protein NUV77_09440, partial [Thermoguttaceae bacterium]|nr:hypothetical protein [Thermoguttaceae bacterium]